MLDKKSMPWTAKTLVSQMSKDNIDFNYAVQRRLVWDNDRKSLFIHSLVDDYPIPPFYFVKEGDGQYGALDGKQRCDAIEGYINGKYALGNIPPVFDEDGNEYNISDLFFQDLPEFARDAISSRSLLIYIFENITENEVVEMFYRLNNGKPLTAIELTRVKAKSLGIFQIIAKHPAIDFAISEIGKKGYNHESVAMQMWAICFIERPSFNTKEFRPMIVNVEVEDDEKILLINCLEMISKLYELYNPDEKEGKKMLRRLKARTHVVSLVYMAKVCIDKGCANKFVDLAKEFFSGSKTTISESYNEAAGRGSGKPESVATRKNAIQEFVNTRIVVD